MGHHWPDVQLYEIESVEDVQSVHVIFLFQGLGFFHHFQLQVGGGVVVIFFQRFFQPGADAFFIVQILGQFHPFGFDGFPASFIDFIIIIQFL